MFSSLLLIDHLAAGLGYSDFLSVLGLVADAGAFSGFLIVVHDVGSIDGSFDLYDLSGDVLLCLLVLGLDVDAFNYYSVFGRDGLEDLSCLALVLACDDEDGVILLDLH